MDDEWILLDFWPSMFAARVRIALSEKGINYESREEDLPNKTPLLLQMNPVHKKTPVLIHNGKPVCESLNIVQYIDEVSSKHEKAVPTFLPSHHPYEKAQAIFWADFIDKKMYEGGRKITWHENTEELDAGKKELMDCLKVLEGELGERLYFGGEALGYVDIALGGFCSWFYSYQTFGNLNIEAECPKLMAWCKRCMNTHESFSKSSKDPHKIYDFVSYWRNKKGLH